MQVGMKVLRFFFIGVNMAILVHPILDLTTLVINLRPVSSNRLLVLTNGELMVHRSDGWLNKDSVKLPLIGVLVMLEVAVLLCKSIFKDMIFAVSFRVVNTVLRVVEVVTVEFTLVMMLTIHVSLLTTVESLTSILNYRFFKNEVDTFGFGDIVNIAVMINKA